jgi:RNA methyltransferase, TrmH family
MLEPSVKKHIVELQQKKHRAAAKEFLVEGVKGVEEALKSSYDVLAVVVEGSRRDEPDFVRCLSLATSRDVGTLFAGRGDIDSIKTTETFPGVLAIVAMPEDDDTVAENGLILALDGVSDPGNMGTIIRVADWFGCKDIFLGPGCVEPWNEKVVRSTMGSIFRTRLHETQRLADELMYLKQQGFAVYIADISGTPISAVPKKEKTVYVFGSESHGVSAEVRALGECVTIAGHGEAESLNVAIAAGICLFNHKIVL